VLLNTTEFLPKKLTSPKKNACHTPGTVIAVQQSLNGLIWLRSDMRWSGLITRHIKT
jgi:hypothetical protein